MPTAGEIMDLSASLQNDTAQTVYTDAAQLPYLRMALKELEETFELNNVPTTNESSAALTIPAGTSILTRLTAPPVGVQYPIDLVDIQKMYETPQGQNAYIPMNRLEFIPHELEANEISQLLYFVWIDEEIRFVAANSPNDIKIDYVKMLFVPVADASTPINVTNAVTYLAYRTAGLCSEFIGENKTRADALNGMAVMSMDRSLGISTKGRQSIVTKRRPFMQAYRRHGRI